MGFIEAMLPPEWAARVIQADPVEFWSGTLFVVAVTVAALYGVVRFLRRARIIEDTPTSRIRSAAQGYVELVGHGELMAGAPIIAPLTGTVCTWYHYKIEEKVESYDGRGARRTRWRTIASGTSDSLFLLRDETGECVIDPDGAEVTPAASEVWYGDKPSWSGGPAASRSRLFTTGRYRFTEKRMHPGDPLYAIGLFRTEGGASDLPSVRDEVRQLLSQWKRDQEALRQRFDRNGDGQIDLQEWEDARQAALAEVVEAQSERLRSPSIHLLMKPQDGRPYILSVLPQERLARRYRRLAGGSFALFLLAGAAATWLLTLRLTH